MPTVRTNDVETYYERRGRGHPLVLVHGAWTDHRMWARQVETLADEYDVVAYDVRGHGRTGGSADQRYSVELLAADLKALVDALNLDRPYVCGLSLGGMIAQTYAVRYADRIGALVLADTAVSTRLTRRDAVLSLLLPKWATAAAVRLLGPERWVDVAFGIASLTRGADWFGRDERVRAYVRETMSGFDAREYNKVFGAVYDFRAVDLTAIEVPTLVVNGEFEDDAAFRHAEVIRRLVPDASTAVIPGAGHVSNMENPDAFDDAVRAFLSEASGGSAGGRDRGASF
ncbi:alpha/beta fold hydrolase [Halegenticoccus soli]|uniref:alpha/beta fold hydrolase n=1 Tax=Halegenticoccus soli TaxID=1985678 RepID=UPI000C6D4FAB|nr:alpha/beta fold hydrolase [Halegenticoccus soli]